MSQLKEIADQYALPISGVSQEIAPDDGMYQGNTEHYMGVGQLAMRMVQLALLAAERRPEDVKSILDLPSGHGRVLRTLRAAFPEAELTASDLLREGVDYCATAFGARPVYSSNDLSEVALGRSFDLIWCGSLLTHLDGPRWREFLEFFEEHLNPDGILLFTVHGQEIVARIAKGWDYGLDTGALTKLIADYQDEGFGYVDYPGNPGYGISLSDRTWTLGQLREFTQLRTLLYCERGWDDHQDVVAVCKDGWEPPEGPASKAHSEIDFGIRGEVVDSEALQDQPPADVRSDE